MKMFVSKDLILLHWNTDIYIQNFAQTGWYFDSGRLSIKKYFYVPMHNCNSNQITTPVVGLFTESKNTGTDRKNKPEDTDFSRGLIEDTGF